MPLQRDPPADSPQLLGSPVRPRLSGATRISLNLANSIPTQKTERTGWKARQLQTKSLGSAMLQRGHGLLAVRRVSDLRTPICAWFADGPSCRSHLRRPRPQTEAAASN